MESLSGGRRPERQEEGRVVELNFFCYFVKVSSAVVERGKLGEAKCDFIRHANCGSPFDSCKSTYLNLSQTKIC